MLVSKSDEEDIWICAVRYGLGRKTYITDTISCYMQAYVSEMSARCKEVMIRDIESCDDYGHDCDKKAWMELLAKLKA